MRTIKKYGNRRLYDTADSRYVNLEDLAALIRGGEEIQVVDAASGADLTRELLLQIVLELHGGLDFLPPGLLRRIIRATGDDPAQRLLRQQLGTALGLLHEQLDRLEATFGGWPRPPGASARTPGAPTSEPPPDADTPPSPSAPGAEVDALRARLQELEARLGKRG